MPYVRSERYPELFKPSGSSRWWCFVPNPKGGRQLRLPTREVDEGAAHRWYRDRIRSGASSALGSSPKKERTLEQALAIRLEWLTAARKHDDPTRKKPSAATIEFYEKKSKPLVHVLGGGLLLSAIGHEEIRRYIVERSKTAKATTIAKELTTLSMAMRLAKKDGVACSAFADIKPEDFASKYVPRERWLSEPEVDALIDILPTKRAAVVAFIVATSATYPSEVEPVRRGMVDVEEYVVHVPGTKASTRDRKLRVPSHARRLLDFALKYATGPGDALFEPWTNIRGDLHDAARLLSMCAPCRKRSLAWAHHEEGATKKSETECKACKKTPVFEPLCPTDLRRTFVQWLVRSGVPYEIVYPMTGHNSPRMLEQVYGKRDATAVADLVEIALKKAPKGARRKTG